MKKIGKFLLGLVIGVWVAVAIFVTISLLSYNDFNQTVFGRHTWLTLTTDEFEPEYEYGSLLIVRRDSDRNIDIGDEVFFFRDNRLQMINLGIVTSKEEGVNSLIFMIDETPIDGDHVIGRSETAQAYPVFGTILSIFQSRWGFLFLVILPTLFAIVYEVLKIIEEVKKVKKEA